MRLVFNNPQVFEDYTTWSFEDKIKYKKVLALIKDIERNPYSGIGKPEPLKYELSGCWSRRIDKEHRLIYRIDEGEESDLVLISCKGHYE